MASQRITSSSWLAWDCPRFSSDKFHVPGHLSVPGKPGWEVSLPPEPSHLTPSPHYGLLSSSCSRRLATCSPSLLPLPRHPASFSDSQLKCHFLGQSFSDSFPTPRLDPIAVTPSHSTPCPFPSQHLSQFTQVCLFD